MDRAEALGVAVTDWTWNARFADLDNDGWQDLYAATGYVRSERWESNVFLRNINGTAYRNETARAGLEDYLPTSSYTYADLDLDGDLDIVSVPVLGPVRVFLNNARGTHALQIELRDLVGNSYGIGSRIVVHYGASGELHQLRELQAGGGFGSFDAAVAHFGLGSYQGVGRIDVLWSTGETTTIGGPFEAGPATSFTAIDPIKLSVRYGGIPSSLRLGTSATCRLPARVPSQVPPRCPTECDTRRESATDRPSLRLR